jgi:hypothetical protein
MLLPAGEYYIADPCYILDEDSYDRLLDETDLFMMNTVNRGGVMIDSVTKNQFAVFSTKYGDGVYRDSSGFEYGVDAGCIACIPVEMCSIGRDNEYINKVTFDKDFVVRYSDGLIVFGDVVINTDPDEYYDDLEEEEEY